ncbi:MAG: aminotransferase class I/II-fold pyridoxal phosphate-dependent enzyme [Chloroflexi bacterium]|nr:aminotransferase class I/II-fold pyridoxal phosphate-dependent enzyme [Chloroflexota bacterium]
MTDVTKLIRSHLSSIEAYTPVDPAEELARRAGISPEEVVKLNGNENPFGAHPEVAGAIGASSLHLYPDPNQNAVRKALADYTGMPFECLLAGAGGDELIDLLLRLFVEPGERLLDCEPTFGMYSFCARVADAQVVSVPRDENFDVDIDPVAAGTAAANVESNNAPGIETITADGVIDPAIAAKAPFGLITANILADPLIGLAPGIAGISASGAALVLSGITREQAAEVQVAYIDAGFTAESRITLDDWCTLVFRRKA